MQYINKTINDLIDRGVTGLDIAYALDISNGMVSTWKNKDNDFVPRLAVAARIYNTYGVVTYPYAEDALKTYGLK